MSETTRLKATLQDVARTAGVSLATVDRVVNRRDGVRGKTVAGVEAALAKLSYRPDAAAARLARNQTFRFAFILPTGANSFTTNLDEQVRRTANWLASQARLHRRPACRRLRSRCLAGALASLSLSYDGVATIALDHPKVRAAIDDVANRGIRVVTLVSDAPSSRRLHYVGIDNPAAGRTAAALMGRFLRGRRGSVGVIAGPLVLRDHAERAIRLPPDPAERISRTVAACRGRRPRRQRAHQRAGRRPALPPARPSSASTASAPATGASPPPWRRQAAPTTSSGSPTSSTVRQRAPSPARRDRCDHQPGPWSRGALPRACLLAHCLGDPVMPDQERINIDIFPARQSPQYDRSESSAHVE